MREKPYIDAHFRVVRGRRKPKRDQWLIWLGMTAFIGMLAIGSAERHTEPPASIQSR